MNRLRTAGMATAASAALAVGFSSNPEKVNADSDAMTCAAQGTDFTVFVHTPDGGIVGDDGPENRRGVNDYYVVKVSCDGLRTARKYCKELGGRVAPNSAMATTPRYYCDKTEQDYTDEREFRNECAPYAAKPSYSTVRPLADGIIRISGLTYERTTPLCKNPPISVMRDRSDFDVVEFGKDGIKQISKKYTVYGSGTKSFKARLETVSCDTDQESRIVALRERVTYLEGRDFQKAKAHYSPPLRQAC